MLGFEFVPFSSQNIMQGVGGRKEGGYRGQEHRGIWMEKGSWQGRGVIMALA